MLNGMEQIQFSKPFIGIEEEEKVLEVLRSGWLTSGKVGEEFEKKFAEYVGAKHVILVNSCTMALRLSIEYNKTKLKFLKSVYLPSFTFAATTTEALNSGLNLRFGDISLEDGCLIPDIENLYDLIIPVHYAGNKAKTDYGITTIEDSAHRIEKNQCLGNDNLVCFSFYATKNLTM
jgi:dTDP-4-amino-4,6-dideoxygalactose transaminase